MNAGKTDYYKILGIGKNASQKDIKNAYRKLARKHHPDANPNDKAAEDRFKEISEAYEVLGDSKKKSEYDRRDDYINRGPNMGGGRAGGAHDFFTDDAASGFNFEDLFQGRSAPQAPAKGDDLYYTLTLGFKEAITGTTKQIRINRRATCKTCHGTGAKAGTSQTRCTTCGGRGVIAQDQGFFSFSKPCPTCGGEGVMVKEHCPACQGAGTLSEDKVVTVNIPAGIHDGGKLKYRRLGQAGHRGAPSGDLFIIIQVDKHPLFRRKRNDILLNLPLSFTEAALGATIKVPTIDGRVSLKIPKATQAGQILRIKGRGAQKTRGTGVGDMLVTVQVEVPSEISPSERELLVRLADQSKEDPRKDIEALAAKP